MLRSSTIVMRIRQTLFVSCMRETPWRHARLESVRLHSGIVGSAHGRGTAGDY